MNRKTTLVFVIASIVFTLFIMIFGRHGSLNPSEVGFYISIGAGILWFIGMYFIFKKILKRLSKKHGTSEKRNSS